MIQLRADKPSANEIARVAEMIKDKPSMLRAYLFLITEANKQTLRGVA